jgi:hypothetical protein
MPQQGYLLIADIAGYTAFLTRGELEHAQDILSTLFHALLDNTRYPLIVSKLEGDAIFSYAPGKSFVNPQILLETIENLYYVFADTQEKMHRNTTCTCTACSLIPTLDLKFAMHYGEFLEVNIGGSQEISGADVILVHRLLKNTITEKTNVKAYAYFTKASIEAAQLTEMAAGMLPHTENYEHLGDVEGYIHDLKPVWKAQREARRVRVDPEKADFIVTRDFPIPPATLWDCMLKPEYRNIFNSSTKTDYAGLKLGRVVRGSEFHCYHGKRLTRQTVVDWHPFDYYTSEDSTSMMLMNGMKTVYTIYFVSNGENTSVQLALGSPTHTNLFMQKLLNLMWKNGMGQMFYQEISKGMQNLKARIVEDLAAGKIAQAVLINHVE